MMRILLTAGFVLSVGCSATEPERKHSTGTMHTSPATDSTSGDAIVARTASESATVLGTAVATSGVIAPLADILQTNVAPPAVAAEVNLRWMIIGDQPLEALSTVADCASSENIARAVCTTAEATCRSKFTVTCDSSSDCRRLFKCTTGTDAGNIWFAMGDNTPVGQFQACPVASSIAGTSCALLNDRCLSVFITATGNPRLFKCLPSGGPGLLFWRWAEDKPVTELTGTDTCSANESIAGTACSNENSKCISSFCTVGTAPSCTERRLFKCNP